MSNSASPESESARHPDLAAEVYNERCLRPKGLCTLGGTCDVCWYGPNSPKTLELIAKRRAER